jgi:hypothetical protein
MKIIDNKIDYYSFTKNSLIKTLGLTLPPFALQAFKQINYIEQYLLDHKSSCKSIVIERHYIDRDYMEDHGVFYSRNLYPYSNWCQRVHFFALEKRKVKQELDEIINIGYKQGKEEYLRACRTFSDKSYLGFSVIKPLQGCPVGRTVLRQYDEDAGDGYTREFTCTREYRTHLLGVELNVLGLAFQQQDIGVSACATTALWVSLQKAKDFEDIGYATPAQITRLASQYTLPFGRSMPSEGLSLDQMCQAVQALGISPTILKATDYKTARAYLYSACKSGFAQVLILQKPGKPEEVHAITVVGMKTTDANELLLKTAMVDKAGDLKALYVHDDRIGPYLRADFTGIADISHLEVGYGRGETRQSQKWALTHILIPMHGKVRLSFDELRSAARNIIDRINSYRKTFVSEKESLDYGVTFETFISRSPAYIEQYIFGPIRISRKKLNILKTQLLLSRYVAVIRLSSSYFGQIDFLIDTTSTPRNIHSLHIVTIGKKTREQEDLVNFLSEEYHCPKLL